MFNRFHQSYSYYESPSFYHQYMHQHAQMTRWLEQVHANIPSSMNHQCHCNCRRNSFCTTMQQNYQPQELYSSSQMTANYCNYVEKRRLANNEARTSKRKKRNKRRKTRNDNSKFVDEYNGFENEDDDELLDDDSSGEIVFNVEAFLAMRATREAKEAEEKKSEKDDGSFELVETPDEEEFIELDSLEKLQHKICARSFPHTIDDLELEKQTREFLYGDQACKIAGLETTMQITFDHLCDLHQPHLWPVLPLLL